MEKNMFRWIMTILLIAAALNVLAKPDAKPAVKQPVFEYKVISDDSMQIAGSIYTFVEGAYTWETAKQKAASLGSELVVFTTGRLTICSTNGQRQILIGVTSWAKTGNGQTAQM
jgi:hypothetical protein